MHCVLDVGAHLLQIRQNVGRRRVECVLCASLCMCNNMVPIGPACELNAKRLMQCVPRAHAQPLIRNFAGSRRRKEAEEGQGEVEGGPGGPPGEEAEEEEAAAGPSFCLLCRLRTC
jgi:hypothetical protein